MLWNIMVSDLNNLTSKNSVNQQSYTTKASFMLFFMVFAGDQV